MTKIAFSEAKKIAMKFFGSEMTPPPFGNFPEIHPFSYPQASLSTIVMIMSMTVLRVIQIVPTTYLDLDI